MPNLFYIGKLTLLPVVSYISTQLENLPREPHTTPSYIEMPTQLLVVSFGCTHFVIPHEWPYYASPYRHAHATFGGVLQAQQVY